MNVIEWYQRKMFNLNLEIENKQISIGEYAVKSFEIYEQAEDMEKKLRIHNLKIGYNQGYMDAQCNHINDADNFVNEQLYIKQ